MKLYAFVAPIRPNKTAEFRQFVNGLQGSRKTEYEAAMKSAGFGRETMVLQNTPGGEMVVVIQEAESAQKALTSLCSMTDPFHVWYFQKLKDIHGIDVVGSDVPMNELLLDYRAA